MGCVILLNPCQLGISSCVLDPWLKKAKKNKKKKPKEKKKKEKKKKRKKDKKEKSHLSESDDSDIDSQFDQALEAAGLKGNGSVNPFNSSQSESGWTSTTWSKPRISLFLFALYSMCIAEMYIVL